jgi:hypothetical protein
MHFVITWDALQQNIYLNGVLVAGRIISSPAFSTVLTTGTFRIGNDLTGDLDEFAIYNRSLSPKK